MPSKSPLPREEVERILQDLAPLTQERRIVLIGGQAVAFWAAFFNLPEDKPVAPIYSSGDIDFEAAPSSARKAGELLGAKFQKPDFDHHTPNTGLVVFTDADGTKRQMDFLESPFGLRADDVRRTAVDLKVRASSGDGEIPVYVIHPERSMESRVYAAMELGRTQAVAMDQLRRSVDCAREWSKLLLDRAPGGAAGIRDVLKLNERIFRKCTQDQRFRQLRVRKPRAADPFDAVLVDDRLPQDFLKRRHPQMLEKLADRRERDLAHHRRYAHTRRKRRGASKVKD